MQHLFRASRLSWADCRGGLPGLRTAVLAVLMGGVLSAQWGGSLPGTGAALGGVEREGFNVNAITAFSSYSVGNTGMGTGLGIPGVDQGGSLLEGDSAVVGVSTSISWSKTLQLGSISFHYSPSYFRPLTSSIGYSGIGFFNQSFGANYTRTVTPRLTLAASLGGSIHDINSYDSLNPSGLNLSDIPSSLDGLLNAMQSGQIGNSQLASILTGSPVLASPAEDLFFGERSLSATASITASYDYSPRLSFNTEFAASRFQRLSSDLPGALSGQNDVSLLANATSGHVSFGVGYSLSLNTSVHAEVATTHALSSLTTSYATTFTGGISHMFGQHWAVHGNAGTGVIEGLKTTSAGGMHVVGGGGVVFHTDGQALSVNVNESLSSSIGIGNVSSTTALGSWTWAPTSQHGRSARPGGGIGSGALPFRRTAC